MTPNVSKRLVRAAEAERQQLAAQRAELLREREEAQRVLERIEGSLYALEERAQLLNQLAGEELAGPAAGHEDEGAVGSPAPVHGADGGGDGLELLRGMKIREQAIRALIERGGRPIHYREWHRLLRDQGYAVSGKDGAATLLTQISRSPLVRRTTSAGVYELDRQAPTRMRQRLREAQSELRQVTGSTPAPGKAASARERRDDLISEIDSLERVLEEAVRVLGSSSGPSAAAAA